MHRVCLCIIFYFLAAFISRWQAFFSHWKLSTYFSNGTFTFIQENATKLKSLFSVGCNHSWNTRPPQGNWRIPAPVSPFGSQKWLSCFQGRLTLEGQLSSCQSAGSGKVKWMPSPSPTICRAEKYSVSFWIHGLFPPYSMILESQTECQIENVMQSRTWFPWVHWRCTVKILDWGIEGSVQLCYSPAIPCYSSLQKSNSLFCPVETQVKTNIQLGS